MSEFPATRSAARSLLWCRSLSQWITMRLNTCTWWCTHRIQGMALAWQPTFSIGLPS